MVYGPEDFVAGNGGGDSSKVAAAQETVVAALATGATYAEAGRQAGRSERTVSRWMADSAFACRVAFARQEHVGMVSGRLNTLAVTATDVLEVLMNSGIPSDQLAAVRVVLGAAPRFRPVADTDSRLLALEMAAATDRSAPIGDEDTDEADVEK